MKDSRSTRLDWQSIRQRLDAAFAKIDQENELPLAEVKRILKARARDLARESTASEFAESMEVLEFQLGHERYAVETCYVREAHPLDNLTTLPNVPNFVMGLMNIRGEILSVVDIKRFFGLPEKGITHLDKVIVLEFRGMIFGIVADELDGVRRLSTTEMDASRQGPIGIDGDYIQAITTSGLAVLDGRALLTDEKIIVS